LRSSNIILWSFSKGNSKTSFQMPVNVTMQEPRSWVVGEESECSVSTINGVHITTKWVHEVEVHIVGWEDDIEGMTVQMEWMATITRNSHLDQTVLRKNEDLFRWKEILRRLGTTKDLEEDGNSG